MTITFVRELDLDALVLDSGGHDQNSEGQMCLLEAAAYVAGEEWTDRPTCVCPTLATFGRTLNDRLPDDKRQLLKPLIPELLGTAARDAAGAAARDAARDAAQQKLAPTVSELQDSAIDLFTRTVRIGREPQPADA